MDCAATLPERTAEPRVNDAESADERIRYRQKMWSGCRIQW